MEVGGPDDLARARTWQRMKFEAGLTKITWEPEFGGRNGTSMQQVIFNQEEAHFDVPSAAFVIGLGMIAPTIKACGTDAQRDRYLTKLLRGEEIWCQMFSEPGAGSDVASLSTTAVRDGDEWVINGQKVWTSGAQYSDFGEIICRTNPDAEKHKGISAFIIDMQAPGVTIKPLKQMNGGASFNEVFFDDVRVPHENLLGDVNEGWTVAITTLMNERVAIGSGGGGGGRTGVTDLIDLARRRGMDSDPVVRQGIADIYAKSRIQRFLSMRTLTAAVEGQDPRAGRLDRQVVRRSGHDADGRTGRHDRRGIGHGARRRRLPVEPVVARRTGRAHRGRLGRSDDEHPRRACARAARRTARRQGHPVEGRLALGGQARRRPTSFPARRRAHRSRGCRRVPD